jgi:hypothetical protein
LKTVLTRLAAVALAVPLLFAPIGLSAQSQQGSVPDRDTMPMLIRSTNYGVHDAVITQVQSIGANNRTTSWQLGASAPTVQAGASNVTLRIWVLRSELGGEGTDAALAALRGSTFRVSVRTNGAVQVITVSGREVRRPSSTAPPELALTVR